MRKTSIGHEILVIPIVGSIIATGLLLSASLKAALIAVGITLAMMYLVESLLRR